MTASRPALGSLPDVVEEHLEEASFLYDQRRYLYRTGRAQWHRLDAIERRIEAHVDGLHIAGDTALALADEDPGAAFIAARLRADLGDVDGVLASKASADVVADAVEGRADASWADRLVEALYNADTAALAARLIGDARLEVAPTLLRALPSAPPELRRELIRALSVLRYPPARSILRVHYLDGVDTARALIRLGVVAGAIWASQELENDSAAPLALAISGDRDAGPRLIALAQTANPSPTVWTALGVFGDADAVDRMIEGVERAPAEAALGLRTLTGADLTESVFVADDPANPDEGGDWIERPSQRVADWAEWWHQFGATVEHGARVRAGQPFSPAVAVGATVGGLADDHLPPALRAALADELAGRYALDVALRPRGFVRYQRQALDAVAQRAAGIRTVGRWDSLRSG